MGEVRFYHLGGVPLERSLPEMLERSLARGWRVIVRCGSESGMAQLDAQLWTHRDDAFLPHGTAAAGHPARQPVYLTIGAENPTDATVLMLVDGARAAPDEMAEFELTCLVFDGADSRKLDTARDDWRVVRAAGLSAVYWAQENGRWVKKAEAQRREPRTSH
jgi:DNA polymerase-3 subunit chi